MKIYHSASELVGNTPLLELVTFSKNRGLHARILAKLEGMNPAGSVKDRTALAMLGEAERSGKLQPGGTIVEPTSGNTGIGLAALAAAKGYKAVFVMPDSMSEERRAFLKAYGAEIVLTEGKQGMKGAIARAEELVVERGAVLMGQFVNPANPEVHYKTTGPEIWADTDGTVDYFVAGVGTGGTVTGTGKFLKEKNPAVKVIAVEPASSPVLSEGRAGAHKIEGIGAGFVPAVLGRDVLDEVMAVSDEEALETARSLAREEGYFAGISSGAALCAAVKIARRKEAEGRTVVVLLPDSGDRYLSTALVKNSL